jgi:ABC-type lipoprotein export system ATPase subunit
MSLIETNAVTRVYQMGTNVVTALDRVNISLDGGEFVAIQGTSGSGKSTLLNLLGGLDRPTSGDVLFDSKALGPLTKKQMARYRRHSVGMIFQNFNLIPTMTAAECAAALAFAAARGASESAPVFARTRRPGGSNGTPAGQLSAVNSNRGHPRASIARESCLPTSRPGTWTQRAASCVFVARDGRS